MKPIINLYHRDNIAFMATVPDKHYDLAIVDPPYFSGPDKLGYYGERVSSVGVKREQYSKVGQWEVPTVEYLNELVRVSKHQIIWGINYYQFFHCVGRIIWDKVNGKSSFSDCEIASCSLHDSTKMYRFMWNGMMQGESALNGTKMKGDKSLNEKRIHPTQKPVALYKWLLHNYAKPGDKILDTHLGSGSIAIACHEMGFSLDACEIDKDYYEAAVKRYQLHISQQQIQFA